MVLKLNVQHAGIHHPFLPNSGVGELQHLFGNREDIAGDIPSAWPSKDMPCSCFWLYIAAWPFLWEEHYWYYGSCFWNGIVFLFLYSGKQKETDGWSIIGVSGMFINNFIFPFSLHFRANLCEKYELENDDYYYFQIKDKDGSQLLNIVHQDKDNHEVKKSAKDSLVWRICVGFVAKGLCKSHTLYFSIFKGILMSVNDFDSLNKFGKQILVLG